MKEKGGCRSIDGEGNGTACMRAGVEEGMMDVVEETGAIATITSYLIGTVATEWVDT